ELRHRVQVVKEYLAVPLVFADDSRLAQVFINLLVNAVHAMGERPLEQNIIRLSTRMDERGQAVVEIRDNGPGMPADVAERIFEPFFTTKPVGEGTGLGLSIAHNIIASAGGELVCDTTVGSGTCFRITLPPHQGQQVSEPVTDVVSSK